MPGSAVVHHPYAAAVLGLVLAAGLTACAPNSGGVADSPQEQAAQTKVAELVRDADRGKDINAFARVAAQWGASEPVALIAIEATDAAQLTDTLGWLTFQVSDDAEVADPAAAAAGPYCFRVGFNYYGKAGEWGTSDGVDPLPCPEDAAPVTPPPDETIVQVVATNAREVAHDVLSRLPESSLPSSDDVAAQVAALLSPATGALTVNAPPTAFVDGSDVGIAMAGADDCVLVSRIDGVVADIYPPRVYLQPGELGCTPSTALADDLRPPH